MRVKNGSVSVNKKEATDEADNTRKIPERDYNRVHVFAAGRCGVSNREHKLIQTKWRQVDILCKDWRVLIKRIIK